MDAPLNYPYRDELNAKRLHEHVHAARMGIGLVNLAERYAKGKPAYVAIALEDCRWDGIVYDSRTEALQHQRGDANQYLYFPLPLEHWGEPVCDVLLNYWRTVYKSQNYRPAGHHSGGEIILPQRIEEIL